MTYVIFALVVFACLIGFLKCLAVSKEIDQAVKDEFCE